MTHSSQARKKIQKALRRQMCPKSFSVLGHLKNALSSGRLAEVLRGKEAGMNQFRNRSMSVFPKGRT